MSRVKEPDHRGWSGVHTENSQATPHSVSKGAIIPAHPSFGNLRASRLDSGVQQRQIESPGGGSHCCRRSDHELRGWIRAGCSPLWQGLSQTQVCRVPPHGAGRPAVTKWGNRLRSCMKPEFNSAAEGSRAGCGEGPLVHMRSLATGAGSRGQAPGASRRGRGLSSASEELAWERGACHHIAQLWGHRSH